MHTARKPLRDSAAEAIAQAADRLEAEADRVRATDKALALRMKREAEKLHARARGFDRRAGHEKRQARRKPMINPLTSDWWTT